MVSLYAPASEPDELRGASPPDARDLPTEELAEGLRRHLPGPEPSRLAVVVAVCLEKPAKPAGFFVPDAPDSPLAWSPNGNQGASPTGMIAVVSMR